MKKKIFFTSILFVIHAYFAQAQVIKKSDTIFLNYFISVGEFGGYDEGLMFYIKDDNLNAIAIRYNKCSTNFILNYISVFYSKKNIEKKTFCYESNIEIIKQRDSLMKIAIIDFYKYSLNLKDYTIIKPEWVLNKEQCDYTYRLLEDIKTQSIEDNVFSNACEHYAIINKNENYVFLDKKGSWNKFFEIKKVFGIKQKF